MRALVSVSDKTGVVDFCRNLRRLGWEIIATGGTQKLLEDSGVETIGISEVTGFPEICDGAHGQSLRQLYKSYKYR